MLSSSSSPTVGSLSTTTPLPKRYIDPISTTLPSSDGASVDVVVKASRSIAISGVVNGKAVSWTQSYSFSNVQHYTSDGLVCDLRSLFPLERSDPASPSFSLRARP